MTADAAFRQDLARAHSPLPDQLSRLHDRLTELAAGAGVLDLVYRTVDSPVGSLLVVATGAGVVRVAFQGEGHDTVLQRLATRISPRILYAPARLDPVARELDEYFAGRRRVFGLRLDWQLTAGFRGVILHHLTEIGYGQTATYASLAQLAGNPRAVRAVGSACATNPLPIVVPCHRVLRSDGGMGGYLGGLAAKRALLSLEAS